MKDLLSRKRKPPDEDNISLSEEYSVIIQSKLPPKLKDPDPGSFTIPCSIGISKLNIERTFCDLGTKPFRTLFPRAKIGISGL
jgi:hypothetical protein